MTLREDTERTSLSLSPAALAWESLSSYESLNTTSYGELNPTLVYLHSKKMSHVHRWESCRWQRTGLYTWKKTHLLMSLDPSGKQRWVQDATIYLTTGGQRQPIIYSRESGIWRRPWIADTSSSTTYPSLFLLRRTEMNGRPLMR